MRNFSTLDLVSGYWQIETGKEAHQKSALVTHRSLHEFVHMPFGLYNVRHVPALDGGCVGWYVMESAFCLHWWCICSETLKEHIAHLTEVFAQLRKANLHWKPLCYCFQWLSSLVPRPSRRGRRQKAWCPLHAYVPLLFRFWLIWLRMDTIRILTYKVRTTDRRLAGLTCQAAC